MAYSTGSTILDDDYNIFATGNADGSGNNAVANINTLWGTGTGDYGYGQTTTISPVSAGTTISATQWATLLTRMTSISNHTGTSITAISNPVTGDTIEAYAALSSNISTIFGNGRLGAVASGTDATVNTVSTSGWNTSSTVTKTFTFDSVDEMRYFFNAGGMIRMSWSRTGGSSTLQNTAWTNLLTASGTIVINYSATNKTIDSVAYTGTTKIGGSGTPVTLATTTGVADYTGSLVTIFNQTSSEVDYNSNDILVQASISGSVITVAVSLLDDYTPPDPSSPDAVDGTLTMASTIRQPSTVYLTNTWGTVTQNSPSWSQT